MPGNPILGAEKKGREAALSGDVKRDDNPYGEGRSQGFRTAWFRGFDSVGEGAVPADEEPTRAPDRRAVNG